MVVSGRAWSSLHRLSILFVLRPADLYNLELRAKVFSPDLKNNPNVKSADIGILIYLYLAPTGLNAYFEHHFET